MSRDPAAGLADVADVRRFAKRRVPKPLFDYIDGGAEDEVTLRANTNAFGTVFLQPRLGQGLTEPRIATDVLGTPVALPVLLAPCGLIRVLHPDGALGVLRAARAAGTVTAISTFAGITPEACANEAGPRWYQLYAADRNAARASMQRAKAAGFEALVVTMDSPTMGNRKRDSGTAAAELSLRNAFRLAPQVVTHPRWFARMAVRTVTALRSSPAPAGPTRPGSQTSRGTSQVHDGHAVPQRVSPFTWADLEWIRAEWSGPLLVKGVLSGHDASQSVELGADAVIVSNHGGRQLEGAPATLTVLPEIVDAVGSRVDVLFDGGIRRGSDIVKALALGARAVMIGRPYLYGLAGAGEAGVARILEILRSEMVRTMQLMGCHDIATLDASWLTTSDAFAPLFASSQLAHSLPNHLERVRSKDT